MVFNITPEQTAADCRAVADVIERNGWHQGGYYFAEAGKLPGDSRVCALGAINVVSHGFPWSPLWHTAGRERGASLVMAITGYILASGHAGDTLVDWNDTPGRTAEEVIAAFRACADRIEARELATV
jgi:hypothetical protein